MLVGSTARRRAHRTEEPLPIKVCHSLLPTGRGTRGAPESPSCLAPNQWKRITLVILPPQVLDYLTALPLHSLTHRKELQVRRLFSSS